MAPTSGVTSEAILAGSQELLSEAGYAVVRNEGVVASFGSEQAFLAEDRYSIVAVIVFDTWGQLASNWVVAQGGLVDLLTDKLAKSDPKSWDGYLVLLTGELTGPTARTEADAIRFDTSRVRKLVATGEDLASIGDLDRVLLPLMPLSTEESGVQYEDVLVSLPEKIAAAGIDKESVRALVNAFRTQEPLMETLRSYLEHR